MIMGSHMCVSMGKSLWTFNKIAALFPSPHAQRQMVLMGKAERQLEKQTGTTEGKMAQVSAFPVKWQVNSASVKLSRPGWTPEGPRVCIRLVSATSLWPEHELPSDSGLATLLHHGEAHVPVLICSAQKSLFCTAPKGTSQCQEM